MTQLRLLLDEQLPGVVAEALRVVRLDCGAVGDEGCPGFGAEDDAVVRWCRERRTVLVTADRSRKRPEMRVALESHRVPVVHLARSTRAVPLLRGLLVAWDAIDEAARQADRAHRHMVVTLDPRTGRLSRVRRGGHRPR